MRRTLVYAYSEMIVSGRYAGLPYLVIFPIGVLVGGQLKLSPEHVASRCVTYVEACAQENLKPEVLATLIVLEGLLHRRVVG